MKKTLNAISKFLSGKGFYVVMACCAMIVAVAGYAAYSKTTKIISEELKNSENNFNSTYSDVNQNISDLLKDDTEEVTETETETETEEETKSVNTQVTKPFAMPLQGEVITPYSNGELVKNETLGTWKTHDGIDIKADEGTPVYSIASGTVKEVKEDGLWGVCITIDHENGIESYYYGLGAGILVKTGDSVDIGQTIGTVGNTAECELNLGAHLHFAVKKNGEWVEPTSVMSKAD